MKSRGKPPGKVDPESIASQLAEEERAHATEPLRAEASERALLETVLAAAPIGLAFIDRELRYVRINETLARVNGPTVEEHLGKRVSEVLPAAAPVIEPLLMRILETGEPLESMEAQLPTPGAAEPRWFLVSFYPVRDPESQAVVGVGAVLIDINDRKVSEQALRDSNDRLREAQRERSAFFDAVTHELRTPLTPLQLQVQLLKASATPDQRQGVDILERNLLRLQRLLVDLSEVSRLDRGRMPLALQDIDLGEVVRHAVATYEGTARHAGVRLESDVAPQLDARGDPQRLAQVLSNLLSNAIKFTPAGGVVRVRALRAEEGGVRVEVVDSGVGLTEAQAQRLFQPFTQVHEGSAGRTGMGLGLFVSKGIIEQHGGTVAVASDGPGHGATFRFTLPAPS